MKTPRTRRALAATSVVLLGVLATGCNGDSGDSSSAPATSEAATSEPVPSQGSEANPFAAELSGPDTGKPDQVLTETLTNKGRLPDAYQVVIEPADAAVVDEANFHLAPGESAKVYIKVVKTPFDVHLKSAGGGAPDQVAMTVQ
ncbi:hypothetical protein [Nocardioides koreensis]|uniref:hypothetical protein n=1 Tax=Nocardioides koreensis TaxID=433651 RepID=UPI0031DBDB4C